MLSSAQISFCITMVHCLADRLGVWSSCGLILTPACTKESLTSYLPTVLHDKFCYNILDLEMCYMWAGAQASSVVIGTGQLFLWAFSLPGCLERGPISIAVRSGPDASLVFYPCTRSAVINNGGSRRAVYFWPW